MKRILNNIEVWFNGKFGWIFNPPSKQGKEKQNSKYK